MKWIEAAAPKDASGVAQDNVWQARWAAMITSLRDGCHVELARPPSVVELAQGTTQLMIQERDETHVDMALGPYCEVIEGDIRAHYPDNKEAADAAVLLLKLALGLVAYGHCTIDVETLVTRAARKLGVASPQLSVGHRELRARFGCGPTHMIRCDRDFVFSTLADLTELVTALAVGDVDDVPTALYVVDALLERPLPYGWLVFQLDFWLIAPWAAIGAYYGTYWDMLGAACISPIVVLTMKLCRVFDISHLEIMLVPLAIGTWTPVVWKFISNGGQPMCHTMPQIFGPMLIHLPGAQLVWGALEIVQGSVIVGASRLVYGLVQAMLLAIFVVVGWQVFGQDMGSYLFSDASLSYEACTSNETFFDEHCASKARTEGVLASLPDSQWCADPSITPNDPSAPSYLTWYWAIGVYNMPLNILCLINVHIRLRDCLGPFIVGQVGLLVLGYLQFQCSTDGNTCAYPMVLQNIIAAFVGTCTAMGVEYLSGLPSAISIIPVLFIFAPGSAAVMSMLGRIRMDAGEARALVNSSSLWEAITSQAVTFMIGIYVAQELWKPLINRKLELRLARRLLQDKEDKPDDPSLPEAAPAGGLDRLNRPSSRPSSRPTSRATSRRNAYESLAAFQRASQATRFTPVARGDGHKNYVRSSVVERASRAGLGAISSASRESLVSSRSILFSVRESRARHTTR